MFIGTPCILDRRLRNLRAYAAMNYNSEREPVLVAALGPESVLASPNPKIYTNLSSCSSTRQMHLTSLGSCLYFSSMRAKKGVYCLQVLDNILVSLGTG